MLCCVLAWMNEYIVEIISATRLWLIFKIQSSHTEKWPPKTDIHVPEWFSSLCLQTNRKHMENQSLICTWETSFYMDNITSTLTIVVFSISWSRMFALYVHQMCWQTQTENFEQPKKRQHRFGITGNVACVPIHAFATTQPIPRFFFSKVLHKIWRIFPRSYDVVISDVPYKVANILFKTNEKAVSFLSTTSGMSRDLSRVHSFSRPHGVSLFGNIERCVVVSISGATSVQWSDVEPALCAFFRSLLRLFSSFPPIWMCEMKVLWKVASSHAEDLKPVFYT